MNDRHSRNDAYVLTISLSEVEALRKQVTDLSEENGHLKSRCAELEAQLRSQTDPEKAKQAKQAKQFRHERGYE